MTVDPRAEARERTGGRFAVRVLEPSPTGHREPPWFADDPVNAPVTGELPVVSPVPNGDRTWDELAAEEPDLRDWCADRWLGAWRRLRPIEDADRFAATRVALHAVAEHVLAPARRAANGKIGLRFTRGGFGTPFFDHEGLPTQLRVDGTDLATVQGDDETRVPLAALASEAPGSHARSTPKPREPGEADLGYAAETAWEPDALRRVDAGAAAQLSDWFGFGCSVLEELRCGRADAGATRVQLWPEHFDLALELGDEAAGARGTFGASPGDAAHPGPYLYVTHWADVAPDPFWNDTAFAGASLGYRDLVEAPDQRAAALAFLRRGLALLEQGT